MNNQPCSPGCEKLNCKCALVFEEMRLVPHEEVVAVMMMQDPDYRKAHRIQQPAFEFASQIYALRKALGVSVEHIAEACALPVSVIQKADRADGVKLVTLARIAEALGCHIKIELVPNDSLPKEEGGEK